jgi:hypothetical protein
MDELSLQFMREMLAIKLSIPRDSRDLSPGKMDF